MDEVGDVRYIFAVDKRAFWLALSLAFMLVASYCIHKSQVIETMLDAAMERVGEE